MDFLDELIKVFQPELYEEMQSPQFEIAKKMLVFRVDNGYSIDELAAYLDLPINQYHSYESGNVNYSVEDYQEKYNRLITFTAFDIHKKIEHKRR